MSSKRNELSSVNSSRKRGSTTTTATAAATATVTTQHSKSRHTEHAKIKSQSRTKFNNKVSAKSSENDSSSDHSNKRFEIGESTIDRYCVLDEIGNGSFGIVWRAHDLQTNRIVAIKRGILLCREINILARLNHSNIVQFINSYEKFLWNKIVHFIILEYCEYNLFDFLQNRMSGYDLSCAKELMRQMCLGLNHMHRLQIAHCDLKPTNILVTRERVVKLADFGMSRVIRTVARDCANVVTLWYKAPELCRDNSDFNLAIDVWSLGCIFIEMYLLEPFICGTNPKSQLQLIESLQVRVPIDEPYRRQRRKLKIILSSFIQDELVIKLISKMLQMDRNRRLTIAAVLKHRTNPKHRSERKTSDYQAARKRPKIQQTEKSSTVVSANDEHSQKNKSSSKKKYNKKRSISKSTRSSSSSSSSSSSTSSTNSSKSSTSSSTCSSSSSFSSIVRMAIGDATTGISLSERFGRIAQWSSDRKFLDSNLNVTKLFDLETKDGHNQNELPPPPKFSVTDENPTLARHYPEKLLSSGPNGIGGWDDARVRYKHYKNMGYLSDINMDDFLKWEDWWYKYQEWLENKKYYENLMKRTSRVNHNMSGYHRTAGNNNRSWSSSQQHQQDLDHLEMQIQQRFQQEEEKQKLKLLMNQQQQQQQQQKQSQKHSSLVSDNINDIDQKAITE